MNYVWMSGGLGNQMFHYALYESLRSLGKVVCIDDSDFNKSEVLNLEVDRVFELSYNRCSSIRCRVARLIARIIRKIVSLFKDNEDYTGYTLHNDWIWGCNFDGRIFSHKNGYYLGFWQGYKYFEKIEDIIRKDFSFPRLDGKNNDFINDINEKYTTIAVHVRGGDYLWSDFKYDMYKVCNRKYYMDAINFVRNAVSEPIMLVFFTNDVDYLKRLDLFGDLPYMVVDWNKGDDSYKDMHLMSLCNHNIIANSSFSYWGAWLNCNNNKVVVYPKPWFRGLDDVMKDACPKNWIGLDVELDLLK